MGEWSSVFSIAKAILEEIVSPSRIFLEAAREGIVSIPMDLLYGARRTAEDLGLYGREVQRDNFDEDIRVINLIISAFQSRDALARMVEIILTDFFDKVPDEALKKMIQKSLPIVAGQQAGRIGMKIALVNLVTRKVTEKALQKIVAKRITKVVNIILVQGIIEQASNASKRLQNSHPRIHQELKSRNLDMLFFVVEDQLQPFLDATRLQRNFPSQFDEILERIKTLLDS